MEHTIKEHMAAHAELQANLALLTTIVGIGVVTAAKVLGEFADLIKHV